MEEEEYDRILNGPMCMLVTVLVLAMAAAVFADVDNPLEDRAPTGGSNVLRACRAGANAGALCDGNGACDSNDCSLGRVDLTINLRKRACNGGADDGDPCIKNSDCAGDDGTCDDVRGWTPSAGQMTSIQGFFSTQVNDAFYEVTEGAFCLRNVSFVVDNAAPNAVVQLTAGECDGIHCAASSECAGNCRSTTANADTGDWGAGGAMRIWTRNVEAPTGFAHEFMHLFGNVRDEYEGKLNGLCGDNLSKSRCYGGSDNGNACGDICVGGDDEDKPCSGDDDCDGGGSCDAVTCEAPGTCDPIFCITDAGATDCVMRSGGGIEMCYSGDHDIDDDDTEQSLCREGNSCWDQFEIEWSSFASAPDGGPSTQGAAPLPDCTVTFFEPSIQTQLVLVVDRSDSMENEDPDRIDVAIDVGSNAIDQLKSDARFGIASFSSSDIVTICTSDPDHPECEDDGDCMSGTCDDDDVDDPDPLGFDATQDFPDPGDPADVVPLSADASNATKTDGKNALSGLSGRTGSFTNIGAGLLKALDMIEASDGPNVLNTSVILLTDGQNNRGNLGAALAELSEKSVPVYLSCIGEARENPQQCADIADQTSGAYVDSSTEDLNTAFVELVAVAQGEELSAVDLGNVVTSGTPVTVPVLIEDGADSARFVVTWDDPLSSIDLKLIDPNDDEIACGISMNQGEFCTINDPAPGEWGMKVSIAAGSDTFNAHAVVNHRALSTSAALSQSSIDWGTDKGFLIAAHPALLMPIEGCEVSADVVHTTVNEGVVEQTFVGTFELNDDGVKGDPVARDGAYHYFFREFIAGDDIYTFTITTSCDPAEGAHYEIHPDPLDSGAEQPDQVLQTAFQRISRFSGVVSGVPENLPPIALICEDVRVECQGELTEVNLLDGTCSFDPDGTVEEYAWSPASSFTDPNVSAPTGSFPLGYNQIGLTTIDDDGDSSVDPDNAWALVADSIPPDLTVPGPITLECNTKGGVEGNDPQILEWLDDATAQDVCEGPIAPVDDAPGFFPAGCPPDGDTTDVNFLAGDSTHNESVDQSSVTVVDTTPPMISVELVPDRLWPPNHRMVEIKATVTVEDVCDEAPTFVLTSITSDEPDNAQGIGDGNTVNDIQDAELGTPDVNFRLRAERAGTGNGRTYTVTYAAMDKCGNKQSASATVAVPHDMAGM